MMEAGDSLVTGKVRWGGWDQVTVVLVPAQSLTSRPLWGVPYCREVVRVASKVYPSTIIL